MTFYRDNAVHLQHPSSKQCLKLEETGRRIWELLEYPISIDEIAQKLVCEFSGSPEDICKDTEKFVDVLVRKDLVTQWKLPPSIEDKQRFRYLHLLKRSLLNLTYPEHELRIRYLEKQQGELLNIEQKRYLRDIRYREPQIYCDLIDSKYYGLLSARVPYRFAHTTNTLSALDNVERLAEIIFADNIPGDFLEAGVCQGGTSIFMRALQVSHGQENRKTWVADSFQGLPKAESKPDVESGMDWTEPSAPYFAFSLQGVRDNFLRYDMLDEMVEFLPGWFSKTLPHTDVKGLAILLLDADLYSSTREVLEHLYPRLTKGGFVIVDDYGLFKVCRRAVDEYRTEYSIEEPIHLVNQQIVYWRKER